MGAFVIEKTEVGKKFLAKIEDDDGLLLTYSIFTNYAEAQTWLARIADVAEDCSVEDEGSVFTLVEIDYPNRANETIRITRRANRDGN